MKTVKLALVAALATGLFACQKDVNSPELTSDASKAQTAQSIMINGLADDSYVITDGATYKFNRNLAAMSEAKYEYNACNPATSGKDNGTKCRQNAEQAAFQERCLYWAMDGHPYWELKSGSASSAETVDVDIDLNMAALSWMTNKTFPLPGGKYSFTLFDPAGGVRIKNLRYSVNGGNEVAIADILPGQVTNGVDLDYISNAFVSKNANAGKVEYTEYTSAIKILESDITPKNNFLTDVWQANTTFTIPGLGEGEHKIRIFGTLKGNDGHADTQVTVSKTVSVSAQGCK